jgi:hypothetical protein
VAAAAAVVFRVWEFWVPLAVGTPLAWWVRRTWGSRAGSVTAGSVTAGAES